MDEVTASKLPQVRAGVFGQDVEPQQETVGAEQAVAMPRLWKAGETAPTLSPPRERVASGLPGSPPTDTTDAGTGTVTAQGENLPNEGKDKAFDNSSGTKWLDFGRKPSR